MSQQRKTISATETIHVARPSDEVFDFTQDYATRPSWDAAITEARVLSDDPRRVRIKARGIGQFTLEYQLFRRGDRTSAAFREVDSWWMSGGGGSWRYVAAGGGTEWTQVNTLELRHPGLLGWLAPLIERNLRSSTRKAMAKAKAVMESRPAPGGVAAT